MSGPCGAEAESLSVLSVRESTDRNLPFHGLARRLVLSDPGPT